MQHLHAISACLQAEKMQGCVLLVDSSTRQAPRSRDEFYVTDLISCKVYHKVWRCGAAYQGITRPCLSSNFVGFRHYTLVSPLECLDCTQSMECKPCLEFMMYDRFLMRWSAVLPCMPVLFTSFILCSKVGTTSTTFPTSTSKLFLPPNHGTPVCAGDWAPHRHHH